jgi:molybdopterin-guanine dinucleotide biosynthesis protein A
VTLKKSEILGVILAGGQGSRMGYVNKPLLEVGGKSMLAHILDRLSAQLDHIIINANQGPALYTRYGRDVVPDQIDGNRGPLAGVLAALDWASLNLPGVRYVMSLPGDAPFIPMNLVAEMTDTLNNAAGNTAPRSSGKPLLARAVSKKQPHHVIGLWPLAIRADLRDSLINKDIRKVDLFTASYRMVEVSFDGVPDPFFNINTAEDKVLADRILKGQQ